MKKSFIRRLACTALAAVAALTIAVIPAMAANVSLPDTTTARSLTIYKYSGNSDYTTGGEGHKQDVSESHEAVANVVYDIYKYAKLGDDVPKAISATDAANWTKANSAKLATSIITDANGKATWAAATGNSADGVYLVVERANVALESASEPFFVSIPYTDVDENQWIYGVVVQPKSVIVPGPEVNKDVTSIDNKDDSDMYKESQTWIIRGEVPADLYRKETINGTATEIYAQSYVFTDVIDSQLDYKGNVRLKVATSIKDKSATEVALTVTTDYTANYDSSTKTLTIALTDAGKKAVMTAVGNTDLTRAEVRAYFDTCINATANVGKEIYNNVILDFTNSTGHKYEPTEVPKEDQPEVHLGGLNILKVDVANKSKTLQGAEYKIATTEANAKAGKYLADAEGKTITMTTDANGKASYAGLTYPQGASTEYFLVETKAPEGYQLAAAPIKVAVNATTYSDATKTYTLTDATKYDLPKAGGHGMMLWIIIGLIVIGTVSVTAVATSRKKKAD